LGKAYTYLSMPTLCTFDEALAREFPKLFSRDEESGVMMESELNTAADWFGPFSPSPLFGGLNPKQPEQTYQTPVGAVFSWDSETKEESPLFDSAEDFSPDFDNYDINNNSVQVKEEEKQENELLPQAMNLKLEYDPIKKVVESQPPEQEKKKRGRPRLHTGHEPMDPKYQLVVDANLSLRALMDRPCDLDNSDEDSITVGSYSKKVRRGKIERFKAKKRRAQIYGPHVRFAIRQQFAGTRPRVSGRFIKMSPYPALVAPDVDMVLSNQELLSDGGVPLAENGFLWPGINNGDFVLPDSDFDQLQLSTDHYARAMLRSTLLGDAPVVFG